MLPRDADYRATWFAEHKGNYPAIVAEIEGEIAGWGSLSPFHERPGWRFTVENAVYVRPDLCGRGIGHAILAHLIDLARKHGHHVLIAHIASDNEPSIRLHEKHGFEKVGMLKETGHKFGHWIDVVLMEKLIP
jgi:phosphinothricin acetyltransferase